MLKFRYVMVWFLSVDCEILRFDGAVVHFECAVLRIDGAVLLFAGAVLRFDGLLIAG